ncbi:TIM21-domain-containing protein [Amylocystis lapponica]|nr:TIM21-domain-containing protein [Amylocystis lapponica]
MNLCRTHALLRRAHSPPVRVHVHVPPRPAALDQKHRTARREDYAGPFQLGIVPPTPRRPPIASGKVARTTARTTNLVVILVGAGLSTLLLYALTSEMFSNNSSTVVYGRACDMIKASPKLAQHLQPPLVFHNNPPSGLRPRHRNHHVSSQIVVDATGREHMLLHFFIQGRPPGTTLASVPEQESSYLDRARQWTTNAAEMSFDEILESVRARGESALEATKRMFRFLSGDRVPRPPPAQPAQKEVVEKKESGWSSGFTGLFSGLRGTAPGASGAHVDASDGNVYTEGEVHADLIMNDKGYFEFRYLLVDIPSSSRRSSRRIFIERGDGVRENEPVMQWHA